MIFHSVLCLLICHYANANMRTVFNEKQLDEQCGIFHGTTHNGHNTNDDNKNTLEDQHQNPNHLRVDKTIVNDKWPWEVIIKDNGAYKCNGMLIKKAWVLTTATCLGDGEVVNLEVEIKGERYTAYSKHIHEGFDATRKMKMAGDVGLIKLTTPVPIEVKNKIAPICLPRSKSQLKQTTECVVTYISKTENGTRSQSAAGKVLDRSKCKTFATTVDGTTNLLMCIRTTNQIRGNCNDAPIMFFTCKSAGFWSVYGLSKFCSTAKTMDYKYSYVFFLPVLKYLEWVKRTIKEHTDHQSVKGITSR